MGVVRFQFDGALQFRERTSEISNAHVGLGKPVMSFRELGIDLDRVLILNGRFLELFLIQVAVAAFEIFLLLDVGVSLACYECAEQSNGKQQNRDFPQRSHPLISPSRATFKRPVSTLQELVRY